MYRSFTVQTSGATNLARVNQLSQLPDSYLEPNESKVQYLFVPVARRELLVATVDSYWHFVDRHNILRSLLWDPYPSLDSLAWLYGASATLFNRRQGGTMTEALSKTENVFLLFAQFIYLRFVIFLRNPGTFERLVEIRSEGTLKLVRILFLEKNLPIHQCRKRLDKNGVLMLP